MSSVPAGSSSSSASLSHQVCLVEDFCVTGRCESRSPLRFCPSYTTPVVAHYDNGHVVRGVMSGSEEMSRTHQLLVSRSKFT